MATLTNWHRPGNKSRRATTWKGTLSFSVGMNLVEAWCHRLSITFPRWDEKGTKFLVLDITSPDEAKRVIKYATEFLTRMSVSENGGKR